MTTLTQRIKNGSGEDRELDCQIAHAFGWMYSIDRDGNVYWRHDDENISPTRQDGGDYPPAYTRDLNAVFALVERELPGWDINLYKYFTGEITVWICEVSKGDSKGEAKAKCGHRALLLALLAAKEPRP